MARIAEAILKDGRRLPYVIQDDPPRGGMKYTYFAPDKSYVVQFFNDPSKAATPEMRRRIEAILGRYNPTLSEAAGGAAGNTEATAKYFADIFCWPTGIVEYPEFGIVCPAYPSNFFFDETSCLCTNLKGVDKRSKWFTSRNRQFLENKELGDFRSMLRMSIMLARSIRRLHAAGLAHSDLSCNNVLIDPTTGSCVVIDIDSLVVPGVFPPEVAGTPTYIAPEVLTTMQYPFGHPNRILPNAHTDLHALAVLIYEYLLMRHPLKGPKVHSTRSAEEDNFLEMGPEALYIEHPTDHSNRPKDLQLLAKDMGPYLEELFQRAFVDGLHHPNDRPTAMEWEKGLVRTWDLLHPCENPECLAGWFILHDPRHPVCPYCGTAVPREDLRRLHLKTKMRGSSGMWMETDVLTAYHEMPICRWHVFSNVFPDEKAVDRTPVADIQKYQGQWLLINRGLKGMRSPSGNPVPIGQAILLKPGTIFQMTDEEFGYLVEVSDNN